MLRLLLRSLPLVLSGFIGAACANSASAPTLGGPGGSGSSSAGGGQGLSGNSSGVGLGGGGGNTGTATLGSDISDATMAGESCQQFAVTFTPRIPLVFVLVDSSGSMFDKNSHPDGGSSDDWVPLGEATLSVMQSLNSQVDFGFGDYGSNGSVSTYTPAGYKAAMCGLLNNVPIAANNYANIDAVYNPLVMADMPPPGKVNTPAQIALGQAAADLTQAAAAQADAGATAGGEYILLVTDGETDFCDDGEALCPTDAVTAEIQTLYSQGIQTLVLGLPSTLTTSSPEALQAFANAGAGVAPVAPPLNPGEAPASETTIYEQCFNGEPGWKALYQAAGLPVAGNVSLATYAAPDASVTNALLYSPTVADVASLTTQIAAALQTVKSCSFDLQGHIMVDLTRAGAGQVAIDGVALPYTANGGADGWTMTSSTELDLVGSACQTWRATGKNITFNFPCEVIIGIPR